jgi:hypothetical protein
MRFKFVRHCYMFFASRGERFAHSISRLIKSQVPFSALNLLYERFDSRNPIEPQT